LRVDSYDKRRRLVVDPVVSFTRYIGGPGTESSPALAVDAQGNSYVGGTILTRPGSLAATATLSTGSTQLFVAKYDQAGSMIYTTIIAGSPAEPDWVNTISGLATDGSGQLIVSGTVFGPSDLPVRAAAQARPRGKLRCLPDEAQCAG
jgi:hypothetical protein